MHFKVKVTIKFWQLKNMSIKSPKNVLVNISSEFVSKMNEKISFCICLRYFTCMTVY